MEIVQQVIFEEQIDENYVPQEEEIKEFAETIGLDPEKEKDLLWIAREGIHAPLPPQWKPCQDKNGDIYFFNFKTGISSWEHPCDEFYREMVKTEKQKLRQSRSSKIEPNEKRLSKKNSKGKQEIILKPIVQRKTLKLDSERKIPFFKEQLPAVLDSVSTITSALQDIEAETKSIKLSVDTNVSSENLNEMIANYEQDKLEDLGSIELYSDIDDIITQDSSSKLPTPEVNELSIIDEVSSRLERTSSPSNKHDHVEDNLNEKDILPNGLKKDILNEVAEERALSKNEKRYEDNLIKDEPSLPKFYPERRSNLESDEDHAGILELKLTSSDIQQHFRDVKVPAAATQENVTKKKVGVKSDNKQPLSVSSQNSIIEKMQSEIMNQSDFVEKEPAEVEAILTDAQEQLKIAEQRLEPIKNFKSQAGEEIQISQQETEKNISDIQSQTSAYNPKASNHDRKSERNQNIAEYSTAEDLRLRDMEMKQDVQLETLKQDLDEGYRKSLSKITATFKEDEKNLQSSFQNKISDLLHDQQYNHLKESINSLNTIKTEKILQEDRAKESAKSGRDEQATVVDNIGLGLPKIQVDEYESDLQDLKNQQLALENRISELQRKSSALSSGKAFLSPPRESDLRFSYFESAERKSRQSTIGRLSQVAWERDEDDLAEARMFLELERRILERKGSRRSTYDRPRSFLQERFNTDIDIKKLLSRYDEANARKTIYDVDLAKERWNRDPSLFRGSVLRLERGPDSALGPSLIYDIPTSSQYVKKLDTFETIVANLQSIDNKLDRLLGVIAYKPTFIDMDFTRPLPSSNFRNLLNNVVEYEFARNWWHYRGWKRPISMQNWKYISGRDLMEQNASLRHENNLLQSPYIKSNILESSPNQEKPSTSANEQLDQG